MTRVFSLRWAVVAVYAIVTIGGVWLVVRSLGTDMFPPADTGQFQLRFLPPPGPRVERPEEIALKPLPATGPGAGPHKAETALLFVGNRTSTYRATTTFLVS